MTENFFQAQSEAEGKEVVVILIRDERAPVCNDQQQYAYSASKKAVWGVLVGGHSVRNVQPLDWTTFVALEDYGLLLRTLMQGIKTDGGS